MSQETIAILSVVAALLPTAAVGALAFFLKRTLAALEAADKKNAADIAEVKKQSEERIRSVEKEVSELKADLPLVYVTREDYIRVMNRMESKIDRLLYTGCAGRKEE